MSDATTSSATLALAAPAEPPWRGVSCRTPGGARAAQVATMSRPIVGHLGLQALDPIAVRELEAPLSFARLRPAQMAVPVLCFRATLVLLVWR